MKPVCDEEYWNQLVNRYSPRLYRMVRLHMPEEFTHSSDIDAIVNGAFIKLQSMVEKDGVMPEDKKVFGLLVRMAREERIDFFRWVRAKTSMEIALDDLPPDDLDSFRDTNPLPEDMLIEAETIEQLYPLIRDSMDSLPHRQREVVKYICLKRLGISETAAALNITEANVSSTLYLARKAIRIYLQKKRAEDQ